MTVRGANYPRRPRDDYPTPPEVVRTLLVNSSIGPTIFDPACGKRNNIVSAARSLGISATGNDIVHGFNFLDSHRQVNRDIVTNPPFGTAGRDAMAFIRHALDLTQKHRRRVAMLLPVDFDSGKTRTDVFGDCQIFAGKLVLLDRIKWFNGKSGSLNHAWFIWNWDHQGPPVIAYARMET